MENAADALKMAGAVLLFVLAVSVAIVSFGQARETADTILDYKDRETVYIDGNLYYETTGTERTVGLETVIPTIYRAYLENYKVVFEGLDSPIYTMKLSNGNEIKKYTLDLETKISSDQSQNIYNVSLANDEQKSEFLCGILYKNFNKSGSKTNFEKKYNVSLPDNSLIEQLNGKVSSGKVIKEYLGVYYQEDNEEVPDVNKTEKRIITYKIENK